VKHSNYNRQKRADKTQNSMFTLTVNHSVIITKLSQLQPPPPFTTHKLHKLPALKQDKIQTMEDNSTVKFHNACSNHRCCSGFIHMESLNIATANNVTYVLQVDAEVIMAEDSVLVI